MVSATLFGAWRPRPEIIMAGLGLISGVASASLGFESGSPYLPRLQPLATVFRLAPELLPIGFYFGAIIALSICLWAGRLWGVEGRRRDIAAVGQGLPVGFYFGAAVALLITTMYAWSAAIQLGIRLQTNSGDDLYLIGASLAAGAVGSGLTHLGCALFVPSLRRPSRIAVTCVVGALAGMLLYMSERKMIEMGWLFIVWQPVVAFCIGRGLLHRSESAHTSV